MGIDGLLSLLKKEMHALLQLLHIIQEKESHSMQQYLCMCFFIEARERWMTC